MAGALKPPEPHAALVRHPILRERFADVLTDTLRSQLLRIEGYAVKFNSHNNYVDIVAQIAEEGLWSPVLRPSQERWLSLSIMVDPSSSMVLWQRQIQRLHAPNYLERLARECLGMVRPGEVSFVVVPKDGGPKPAAC